jgi:hypothetical protein
MAIVTGHNRDRAVPRPAWVRRHDSQHEGLVAAIMLSLVIIGLGLFLFWGPLLRAVATNPWFPTPLAVTDRPAEGAIPPGPVVVVTLDQPVVASAVVVEEARAAWTGSDATPGQAASDRVVSEQSIADHDLAIVAARPLPSGEEAAEAGAASEEAAVAARQPVPAATLAPTAVPAATSVPAATAVSRATVVATPAATAVAGTGRRARIVKTGGRGVVLYSSPRQGARLPAGILEGAIVSVLETSGAEWTRVQGAGQTGWVRSEFLAPAN